MCIGNGVIQMTTPKEVLSMLTVLLCITYHHRHVTKPSSVKGNDCHQLSTSSLQRGPLNLNPFLQGLISKVKYVKTQHSCFFVYKNIEYVDLKIY